MASRRRTPLPSREDLLGRTLPQLRGMLGGLGVELDETGMAEAAMSAYRRIARSIEDGTVALDDVTWEMLDTQLQRAFKIEVQRAIKAIVRQHRMSMLEQNPDLMLRWIATLVRTCPSCLRRHGLEKTLSEWEADGLPGSLALICDGNCNCELLPSDPDQFDGLDEALSED